MSARGFADFADPFDADGLCCCAGALRGDVTITAAQVKAQNAA